MVEHQSTLNENMPLRFLLYYTEILKIYIAQKNLNVFSKKAIELPRPEFFVVYNGVENFTDIELYLKKNLKEIDEYIFNISR